MGGLNPLKTLDSLIYRNEIPVIIGVFINYGRFPNPQKPNEEERTNRSYEYDTLNDTYARFLEEEILSKIEKKYNFFKDPEQRAIAGHSSGAICAWTVAWQRPDLFRKVLSLNGSFVNISGGDRYPYMIWNAEPKPLKIFLFTGENDGDSKHGNWFLANRQMAAALKYAGYDFKFMYGKGSHHIKHAANIFPDALNWLWSDYEENKSIK